MQWVLHPPPLASLLSPPGDTSSGMQWRGPGLRFPGEGLESAVAWDAAPSALNMEKGLGKKEKTGK